MSNKINRVEDRKLKPHWYKDELMKKCRKFIDSNEISCPDVIYQVDGMDQRSVGFIEEICELVGYYGEK